MLCRTWDTLYQQYESAALRRVQKKHANRFFSDSAEAEKLDHKIAEALRNLRDHEKQHGCR